MAAPAWRPPAAAVRTPQTALRVQFLLHHWGAGRGDGSHVQFPTAEVALHARGVGGGKSSRAGAWRASQRQGPVSPCLCGHITNGAQGASPLPAPQGPASLRTSAGGSGHSCFSNCPAPLPLAKKNEATGGRSRLCSPLAASPRSPAPPLCWQLHQRPGDSQLGPQMTPRAVGHLLATRGCGQWGGLPLSVPAENTRRHSERCRQWELT